MKTGFITTDYFEYPNSHNKRMAKVCLTAAKKSGLLIEEFDDSHIKMRGFKKQFLKYYTNTIRYHVKEGGQLYKEMFRIIEVIFW